MSAATTPRLKVSREGIALIKSFEGFRPRAVPDEAGGWVIGYGHTAYAREGLTIRQQDAELLLQYDLLPVVKALNDGLVPPPNQHQFDALASFALSIGLDRFLSSDVLQRLTAGQTAEAAEALIGWPETLAPDAALRRRAAERALFGADPASPVHLIDLLAAPVSPLMETPPPAPSTAGARAAAVAVLLGEKAEAEAVDMPAGSTDADPAWDPEPLPFQSVAFPPAATAAPGLERYSPYGAAIVGPLPGFPPVASEPTVEALAPEAPVQTESAPAEAVPPTTAEEAPAAPMASGPPPPSPFPTMAPPLILTPATEADFVETPAQEDDAGAPAAESKALFEEEPTVSVLRHEVETVPPPRFDWGETGAFLIMGGVGLAACGAAAAAFRLAVERPSPMGETTVIAWALAVIGVICVGVSAWNLYVRWGKPD